MNNTMLWEELVPGGHHWSGLLRRGTALRLTDQRGGANVSALFYNADEKLERYNMPDTLKAQHTAFLTTGNVCYSDMGRVLCSITEDTVGWHDTWCGAIDAEQVHQRWGDKTFQQHRNAMHRNGRDGLLVELAKWGLGPRDLVPNVNFFSKVQVNDDGQLGFVADHSREGDFVDLRFEMNTIVVLSSCQHRLDPNPRYEPTAVELRCWRSGTAGQDDACRLSMPENGRGFINTERYYL